MSRSLEEIAEIFNSVDVEMKVQILLDYARKLPPVPERLSAGKEAHRVHECMTPLHLWVETETDGTTRLYIDVAEEAPTIRGLAGILVDAYDGAPRERFDSLPDDLVNALGLGDVIRMNRVVGVAALVARIRRAVAAA